MSARQQAKRARHAAFMRRIRRKNFGCLTLIVLRDRLGRVKRRTYIEASIVNDGVNFTFPFTVMNGDTINLKERFHA